MLESIAVILFIFASLACYRCYNLYEENYKLRQCIVPYTFYAVVNKDNKIFSVYEKESEAKFFSEYLHNGSSVKPVRICL